MRPPISVCQSGLERKPMTLLVLFILGVSLLFFSGCAEETVDEAADCQKQLDNRSFQVVADNANCGDYERGSAELGLAGFLFENFMTDEANSNFPSALNLSAAGCATTGTDALVGSYSSTYQQKYLRAQYWSRTKPLAESTTRSNALIGVSYFATLGEIITETYCQIDGNLDGSVSDAENNSFTKINIGSSAVGSSNLNSATGYYQIVNSGVPWLCDSTDTTSTACRQDLAYEGVWDELGTAATDSYANVSGTGSITAVSVIVKVESLQQLFDPTATTADINNPYAFLSMYSNRAALLLADLTSLGVSESDDIYENVRESVGQLDNGGTCTNSSAQVLDLMTTIVQNAAPQTSTATLPSTNYQSYNLLNTSEISQIDTTESSLTCTICPAGVTMKARLIYKKGATYTGLYKTADTAIENTLSNLATLSLDSSNTLIPIVAGDEKITLKELLCLDG